MLVHRPTPRALRFHDLMWYRVSEVLLVSSPYDAFILEQDGQLTEQVFRQYADLSLPAAPRFTHAQSGEAAIRMLEVRRFDLVLTMTSLADMDVNAFGRRVKELRPGRPVVLLALDRKELHQLWRAIDRQAIDAAFLWSGDSKILLAIIKYVEDRQNLDLDIEHGDLKVILVVEDSPAYYSSFLGLLYHELTTQSLSLYSEGLNKIQRQMYMKSRPKILLASSYEEGVELYERYRKNLLALICDVGIPRRGEVDKTAGLDFVRRARRTQRDLPVLLQSAEPQHRRSAEKACAAFIDKGSHRLLKRIRDFLRHSLGFGDFVFRTADGEEVARARDLRELVANLETIPDESLFFHAEHNHFSIWLMARGEFELAQRLRPRRVTDFPTLAASRRYLVGVLRETYRWAQRGQVADFSRQDFEQHAFIRLGEGALGGKARGIAFLNLTLADRGRKDFGGLEVGLPKTIVITTDHFDRFLDDNDLRELAYTSEDDQEIARRFLAAPLSDPLMQDLDFITRQLEVPLAVRSSSLLEDSLHQRLAGIYSTLMLPNNAADPARRLRELADAVKLVYASTFVRNAKSYLRATGKRAEEEKMAVILQEIVGRQHGPRFYPSFSGVAQSYNFYPIAPQEAEDGIVHVALGFGRIVVDGGQALRFSPRHPQVLPQFAVAKTLLDRSQRGFYALDMEGRREPAPDLFSTLHYHGLEIAEEDGTLRPLGSVYRPDERRIRDDLSLSGPRVITFNNILKYKAVALPAAMRKVLRMGTAGLGRAVEIEFAADMGDWGRRRRRGVPRAQPKLYLLQIRPFAARHGGLEKMRIRFRRRDRLCASSLSLGNGVIDDIRDVVYVRYERWQADANPRIAEEIGALNRDLGGEDRPYLLVGPGRWGTADPWLGIPVQWSQISHARVMVEASPRGYDVEPSQGTHFFQNITSLEIGYLSLPSGADRGGGGDDFLDRAWLDAQPGHRQTEHLRHLRFAEPLTVVLDGRRGRAVIAKPGVAQE